MPETGFIDGKHRSTSKQATALGEFAERFLAWVENGRLEEKKVLPKRLAAPEGDICVAYGSRPDHGPF